MNTELLHCSPKITTTLLIRYIPIQTVFDIKKLKLKKKYIRSCLYII